MPPPFQGRHIGRHGYFFLSGSRPLALGFELFFICEWEESL